MEVSSMKLLCDMQGELAEALQSLTGKQSNGLLDHFLVFLARYIDRAVDGYTVLRKASRVDSSKLLIRPAIEAMIRALAVQKQPELLYRIARTERMEFSRMARPIAVKAGRDYDTGDEKAWNVFKQKYVAHFPKHKLVDKELKLSDAAEIAGIKSYYDRAYRFYCPFVHAAFRPRTLDAHTDSIDNWTMATCACGGLEIVVFAGGEAPKLNLLRARLRTLRTSRTAKAFN
jgi:hypothetical protein